MCTLLNYLYFQYFHFLLLDTLTNKIQYINNKTLLIPGVRITSYPAVIMKTVYEIVTINSISTRYKGERRVHPEGEQDNSTRTERVDPM